MARRQIGQEVFASVANPIAQRGSLNRLPGLIDWSLFKQHFLDQSQAQESRKYNQTA